MENQITQETTSIQTPTTQVEGNELVKTETPKQNNFLVVLLSLLLIASVIIAGFFAYQTQKLVKELTIIRDEPTISLSTESTPEPTIESIATPDPTADWETYVNTENGYSIKFPSESYIRLMCEGEELTVSVRTASDDRKSPVGPLPCNRGSKFDIEAKTYLTIQSEPQEDQYYKIEKKNLLMGGIEGKLYIYTFTNIEEGPYPKWYAIARVNKKNKTYEVYFGNKEKLDLFNQILSTFKFIN